MSFKIETIVDRILSAKQANPATITAKLEDDIDELVYDLYGLTLEEKQIVKEGVSRGGTPAGEDDVDDSDADAVPEPEKKPTKKRKAALPPSLPGWD